MNVEVSQEELAKFGYRSVEESRKFSESSYISLACWNLLSKYWQFQNYFFWLSSGKKFTKRKECCVSLYLTIILFIFRFYLIFKSDTITFVSQKFISQKSFMSKSLYNNIDGYFFKHGNSFCNYACMLIQPLKIRSLNL